VWAGEGTSVASRYVHPVRLPGANDIPPFKDLELTLQKAAPVLIFSMSALALGKVTTSARLFGPRRTGSQGTRMGRENGKGRVRCSDARF